MYPHKHTGLDPRTGDMVPLAATVTHPKRGVVRLQAMTGYDLATLKSGDETIYCVTDGEDSWMFKIDLAENEEIVSIEHNQVERYIEVTTDVR